MKERLRQFMVHKAVSAADLADKIGVQRSNVSHILNGRNNPGSQFIEKLLKAYPDLNAGWLMTGMGEMIQLSDKAKLPPSEGSLFPPASLSSHPPAKAKQEVEEASVKPSIPRDSTVAPSNARKRIEKVVFFYHDHTFSEFYPE